MTVFDNIFDILLPDQGNLLHDCRLAPVAAPEEFTVIGAVGAISQQLDEFVNRAAVTETYGQYKRPEIIVNMIGNLFFDRPKNRAVFWEFCR